MRMIISFLMLLSLSLSAKVSDGAKIEAEKINKMLFQLGDIKHSILELSQFQSIHGNCWKLMDGSPLAGTDLKALTSLTNLPDSRTQGTFLRQATSSRTLGSYEADEIEDHNHTKVRTDQKRSGTLSLFDDGGSAFPYETVNSGSAGGTESRPKNLAVNLFVKVNNNCE